MRFMNKMLIVVALMVALMALGCGQAAKEAKPAAGGHGKADVTEKVKAAGFPIMDLAAAKAIVGNGVWNAKRGTLVDARPARKYDGGHIPTAKLIPDTKMDKYLPAFQKLNLPKDALIATYCGGLKCAKSLIVAKKLRELGYTNVQVFLAGQPAWNKAGNYNEVTMAGAAKLMKKGATFIDARPERKFKKMTIAGSVVVPDTKFAKFVGNLPKDKKAPAVTFCGGFKCEKSHAVARHMKKMGYKKVFVYAGGAPEWKKAGKPMAPGGKASAAPKKKMAAAPSAGLPVEEPGILITDFFKSDLLDPAKRASHGVTLVDVRNADEIAAGAIPGSVKINSKEVSKGCDAFMAMLPKGKVVFHCASGGRAGETYFFLADDCKPADLGRFYFLDAGVNCDSQPCVIE